jgi:hypothetical protein
MTEEILTLSIRGLTTNAKAFLMQLFFESKKI